MKHTIKHTIKKEAS